MSFDIQHAIDSGTGNSAATVYISGVTRQIILDALYTYTEVYKWYPAVTSVDDAMAALDAAFDEVMTDVQIQLFPIGTVLPFSGSVTDIPTGWLHCNGASFNTELYPELFALIGYKFGGSGSFYHVPETRLTFLRGGNTDSGTTGGSSTATLSGIHIPAHTHTVTGYTTSAAFVGTGATTRYPPTSNGTTVASGSYGGSAGVAQPFAIIPPYVEVIYMIYAGTM